MVLKMVVVMESQTVARKDDMMAVMMVALRASKTVDQLVVMKDM
jgi:hypothetical protein